MTTLPAVALLLIPPSHHFLRDRLFDSATVPYAGDDILAPYTLLRRLATDAGVPVHTIDRLESGAVAERHVVVSMGMVGPERELARRADVDLAAFFAMECPIVEPSIYRALHRLQTYYRTLYTWSSPLALLPFTTELIRAERFFWPQCFDRVHETLWARSDRQFLVMINGNKLPRLGRGELYTQRLKALVEFEAHGEIDLFGREWDLPPYRVGRTWVPWTARRFLRTLWAVRHRIRPHLEYEAARRAWRGPAESKSSTLSGYRFALCFENQSLEGWITEKIFDCFFAGTVPVYWGATDIEQWIPAETFVDMRQFSDFAELRVHLRNLSTEEIQAHREAAREFLGSQAFERFRKETFARRLLQIATREPDPKDDRVRHP